MLFIGPADLSMELGIFGQFNHPEFLAAVEKTVKAANKAGKASGILFLIQRNTPDTINWEFVLLPAVQMLHL